MKKLTLILVVLLTVGLVGAFAEVTVSGDLEHVIEIGENDASGFFNKGRVYFDADVDEFNSVNLTIDGWQGNSTTASVFEFKVMTDVAGALGIEGVSLDTTIGSFQADFTNYSVATWHDLRMPYASVARGDTANGAIRVDLGIDPVALHWVNSFKDNTDDKIVGDFIVGLSGAVDAASFWLTYQATGDDPDLGNMYAEANYDLAIDDMTSVAFPVSFMYNVDADAADGEVYGYNAGVKGSYDIVSLGVAASGDDLEAFRKIDADVSVAVAENAEVYGALYADLVADDMVNGMEAGANYKIGALKLQAGYFFTQNDALAAWEEARYGWYGTPLQSGFYLATDIAW